MNTIFLRDFNQIVRKHPKTWNTPCQLPRDKDCGSFLNSKLISRIDDGLRIVEWTKNGVNYWTHFDEVFIKKPTKLLGKTYINNMKEI